MNIEKELDKNRFREPGRFLEEAAMNAAQRGLTQPKLRFWAPVISIAATAAVLALAFTLVWQAPAAYSFSQTIEALSTVNGMRVVEKFRHGPSQRYESGGGWGQTTYHPANPMETTEIHYQEREGVKMLRRESPRGRIVRKGSLALATDFQTGDRHFYLDSSPPWMSMFIDPLQLFVDLDEAATEGEARYKILPKPDAAGNLEIMLYLKGEPGFQRLWVDTKSFLPVRLQFFSTDYPEYGEEVVMSEYEFHDIGARFDPELFDIEPADAELEKLGLTREDLQDLPPGVTSIEIAGENEGAEVLVEIYDDNGHRSIAGNLPIVWVEQPAGNLILDMKSEEPLTLIVNGARLSASGPRLLGQISPNGQACIRGGPIEAEGIDEIRKLME